MNWSGGSCFVIELYGFFVAVVFQGVWWVDVNVEVWVVVWG